MREASDRGAGTLNETDGGRLFALTGATGFLGSHLMAGLIRAGHRVVVLGRSRNGTGLADRVDALLDWFGLESCRERIDAVEVDLLEPRLGLSRRRYDTLCPLTAGIIHCASDTRFSERCRRESMDINVAGLHGIVTLARDAGAGCFHYVSTAYVCPTSPSLCAEVPAGPRAFANVYEEMKTLAEAEVAALCSRHAVPYTIVRPSIVYGDSATGRSNRFNALYYHVRALQLIRDIYLNDIEHHGGLRSRGAGIHLDDEGTLHLPLRIFIPRRGQVNLIPVDHFVAVMAEILGDPRTGTIYHVTSDAPRTTEELAGYCERFLRIRGIELVCGEEMDRTVQNPAEEVFNKLVKPYLPYLADTRRFDRRNTAKLTAGLSTPEMTYAVFERCMRYAVSVNWGSTNGRPPGAM